MAGRALEAHRGAGALIKFISRPTTTQARGGQAGLHASLPYRHNIDLVHTHLSRAQHGIESGARGDLQSITDMSARAGDKVEGRTQPARPTKHVPMLTRTYACCHQKPKRTEPPRPQKLKRRCPSHHFHSQPQPGTLIVFDSRFYSATRQLMS